MGNAYALTAPDVAKGVPTFPLDSAGAIITS